MTGEDDAKVRESVLQFLQTEDLRHDSPVSGLDEIGDSDSEAEARLSLGVEQSFVRPMIQIV